MASHLSVGLSVRLSVCQCLRFSGNRKAIKTSNLVETQCWTTVIRGENLRSKGQKGKAAVNENVKVVFLRISSSKMDQFFKTVTFGFRINSAIDTELEMLFICCYE